MSPSLITAAVPRRTQVAFVTVSWNGSLLRLRPTASAQFELSSNDQAGVRSLGGDIYDWAADVGIEQVVVRRGTSEGPRQTSRDATRIETILQLLPWTCIHVPVQRITPWLASGDWLLPQYNSGSHQTPFIKELWQQAIETAAFGLTHDLSGQ